jgi:hypothetical protein
MVAAGIAGWWYNWHLAATAGQYYTKLSLFGPLGLFGGLVVMMKPEWAGPIRSDSTRGHKAAIFTVIGLMAIASGIDMYLLHHGQHPGASLAAMTPAFNTSLKPAAAEITFMARTYRLASYNQKHNPMWEFVSGGEKIDDWTTLLTVVERPDAHTRQELDRLSEGLVSAYRSNGGQVLSAKTMQEESGAVFNYVVAAFEQPAKQRFELNFVKAQLGAKNAVVMIYGIRITDPKDYLSKAKKFLNESSGEVGRALGNTELPDISKLPRKEF